MEENQSRTLQAVTERIAQIYDAWPRSQRRFAGSLLWIVGTVIGGALGHALIGLFIGFLGCVLVLEQKWQIIAAFVLLVVLPVSSLIFKIGVASLIAHRSPAATFR